MSRLDDRLTRELERAARPADPSDAFQRVDRRRARRNVLRRVQATGLVFVVLAGTVGGFLVLNRAFQSISTGPADELLPRNGAIVFSRTVNGQQHLWIEQPDGSRSQLTDSFEGSGDNDTFADISPDGTTVLFAGSTSAATVGLYTVGIGGGPVKALTKPPIQATYPSWSPDGTRIAFSGSNGEAEGIFVMDADGTDVQLIRHDLSFSGFPTWTPDGSRIVFSASEAENGDAGFQLDLYSVAPDGTDLRQLTTTADVWEAAADLSPDGATIVLSGQTGTGDGTQASILLMDADGTNVRTLIPTPGIFGSPEWSPDRTLIVFQRFDSPSTIFTVRPDGTNLTRIGEGSAPAWQALAPDSSIAPPPSATVTNGALVVAMPDVFGLSDLYTVDPVTGATRRLTNDPIDESDAAVSPDGRYVAYTQTDEHGLTSIRVIEIDGGGVVTLTDPAWGATDAAWSPDGTRIAFAASPEGHEGIFWMNLDDGGTVPVTDDSVASEADPSWSPDGRKVVFSAREPADTSEPLNLDLYVFDLVNGTTSRLTETPDRNEVQPSWSPSGDSIAYVQVSSSLNDPLDGGISLIAPDGTPLKVLTAGGGLDQHPTWSPDGSLVAFDRSSIGEATVYTVDPSDLDLVEIGPGVAPAWQPIGDDLPSVVIPVPSWDERNSVDIGLSFPVCNVETLNDDFNGDGIVDTAWTATKAADVGPCPTFDGSFTVIAIDVTGDGVADGAAGPLEHCIACHPFAATDLDGDGVRELVVITQLASTTEYTLFSIHPERAAAGQALEWISVAPPGDADAGFRAGEPFTFWAGGDAGYASYVRCADARHDLIITQTSHPVEGPGSDVRHVRYTELRLADGQMRVIGRNDSTEPNTPPFEGWTGPACGVGFWPGS